MGEIAFTHCTYKSGDLPLVLVTIYTYKSKVEVQKNFDMSMKSVGNAELVSGLGDGAYWWKDKGTFFVAKDKQMVTIFLGQSVASLTAAKSLAEKVVQKV